MEVNPYPSGPLRFNDGHVIHDGGAWRIIDVTRLSDGCKVVLQAVSLLVDEYEPTITYSLSRRTLRQDSRIHAIPILVYLRVENLALIVIPMFHPFFSPPFHCRIEFLEPFRQFLAE
ncbi:hypothetical protein F5146DRAFT_1135628 [Armillaria mellea]|nr:hypothetical protein F5146DRAFT_1135628 [Armillaria mellea]